MNEAPSKGRRAARRRGKRGCLVVTVLFLVLCSTAYLQRMDLLRLGIESFLAHRLQADVSLLSADLSNSQLQLQALRIDAPGIEPRLLSLQAQSVLLQASWEQLRGGHIAELHVVGGTITAKPTENLASPEAPSALELPDIGHLVVEGLTVQLLDADQTYEFSLTAEIWNLAEQPRGEAHLASPHIDLDPLYQLISPQSSSQLSGNVEGLTVHWQKDSEDHRADLETSSASLQLAGQWITARDLAIRCPDLQLLEEVQLDATSLAIETPDGSWTEHDVSMTAHVAARAPSRDADIANDFPVETEDTNHDANGGWTVVLEPQLAWFDVARLQAQVDPEYAVGNFTVQVAGLRWPLVSDPVVASAVVGSAVVEGTFDIDVARKDDTVEGTAKLLHLSGPWQLSDVRLRPDQLPMTAHFLGRLPVAPETAHPKEATQSKLADLAVDGTLTLSSEDPKARRLTVTATGAWRPLADPAWVDVQVKAQQQDLRRLESFLVSSPLAAEWQARGSLDIDAKVRGAITDLRGQAKVHWRQGSLQLPVQESGPQLELKISDAVADLLLGPVLQAPKITLGGTLSTPGWPIISFKGQTAWRTPAAGAPSVLSIERLHLDIADLGRLAVQGSATAYGLSDELPLLSDVVVDGKLDFQDLTLNDLQRTASTVLGEPLGLPDLGGNITGTWHVTTEPVDDPSSRSPRNADPRSAWHPSRSAWHLRGPLILKNLGYSSEDGSRVVEGLGLDLELSAEASPGAPWQAQVAGEVSGFLLLWDTFFGNFEDWKGTTTVQASGPPINVMPLEPGAPTFDEISVAFDLPQGPQFEATIRPIPSDQSAASPAYSYSATFNIDDLAHTHSRYLHPTFETWVGDSMAGRLRLNAAGTIASAQHWTSKGHAQLDDMSWAGLLSTSGKGFQLDLPIDLRADRAATPLQRGHLAFERLVLSNLELPAVSTGLWTRGPSLGLDGALLLPLFGGDLKLDGVQIVDFLGPQPQFLSALQLRQLDLAAMAASADVLPLEGTLNGQFEQIRIAGQNLTVQGGGRIALLGGSVEVGSISGSEIFSRFPRLKLSSSFQNIDLGQLTRKLDFGEMRGTLQGSIDDCALFRGVPVTCRAHLETVDRPGVKRSIDVKAVNNLTILGTGASTNVLDRGIQRLFNRFTYKRLAFDVELADDALQLRGLEKQGEKELFMSGRLPFPIQIINAQPGRSVSFQTMLQRLESLDFDRVTTGSP